MKNIFFGRFYFVNTDLWWTIHNWKHTTLETNTIEWSHNRATQSRSYKRGCGSYNYTEANNHSIGRHFCGGQNNKIEPCETCRHHCKDMVSNSSQTGNNSFPCWWLICCRRFALVITFKSNGYEMFIYWIKGVHSNDMMDIVKCC